MQNCPLVTCGESLRRIEYKFPEDATPENVRFVVLPPQSECCQLHEAQDAEQIDARTYRFPFVIPLDAPDGLYALVVLSRAGNGGVFMDELPFSVQQPKEECLKLFGEGMRIEISNNISPGFSWVLGFENPDQALVQKAIEQGHTGHCACRKVWGDGSCECKHEAPEEGAFPQTIKGWQEAIYEWAKGKGWWDKPRSFGDLTALFHSEISEAFEEHRSGHGLTEVYENTTDRPGKPEGIPVELADCVIRIFDFCGWAGIDLQAMLEWKHAYNHKRPYRHGGKVV